MANFSSDQKYLDKYGLSLFWDKVRQYIQNQIGGIDGTDVKLYPSGETNPTVTDQIEKLWNSIGSGELEGGISGSIEAILGQYVKDIQHADSQTTPLKVVVNEGTGNEADFYTVTLEDNGLANTLSDLTTNRVSSLDPVNGGGSVTLAVDKNKGDVTLTINSQELTNKVAGLETTINGMVKSVNKVENGDGTYVKLNIDPITGDVKLSINDQSLVSELTSIKNNYAKTEDLPTTLPNPHKFTLTYRDKENQEKVVVYDGSSAKDVDFSLYHATTSTTATRVSNSLKVIDASGNAYDYNGGVMVDLSDGINYAANSGKLGGQLPSYYGKQSDITTISQKIAELEALTHVNQITTGDGASDLVKIGFDVSTGNVVASIDETNLSNKLTSIDNYTINSKKISTNPVLTGSDITLGTTVGDNQNYPTTTTLTSSIQKLRETIAGLGQVVEIKGILETLPATTEGYGNGDVVIVGNKEYICYNSQWYLLGDTTELSQDVSTIKSSYVKSIKATGTGVTVSPTTASTGDVTINVDATPITNAISELEANFGNYLPLSGGTLTGSLYVQTSDSNGFANEMDGKGSYFIHVPNVASTSGWARGLSLYDDATLTTRELIASFGGSEGNQYDYLGGTYDNHILQLRLSDKLSSFYGNVKTYGKFIGDLQGTAKNARELIPIQNQEEDEPLPNAMIQGFRIKFKRHDKVGFGTDANGYWWTAVDVNAVGGGGTSAGKRLQLMFTNSDGNPTATDKLYARFGRDEEWRSPRELAFTDSNVASATTSNTAKYFSRTVNISHDGTTEKYKKFARINVSAGAYTLSEGILNIYSAQSSGRLHFAFRTQASIANVGIVLNWEALSNKSFDRWVYAVKIEDGIYDLYIKSIDAWNNDTIELISQFDNIELVANQPWVDSITSVNVSSNTSVSAKLQTARTLWGQSFDGTGNVDGDVVVSGKIAIRAEGVDYTIFGDSNNASYLRGSAVSLQTGGTTRLLVSSEGNVGIGTTNPAEKLEVNGNVKATTFKGNLEGTANVSKVIKTTSTNVTTHPGDYHIGYSTVSRDYVGSLPCGNNANGILTINTYAGNYLHQLGFTSTGLYHRNFDGTALDTTKAWDKIAYTSDIPTIPTSLKNPYSLTIQKNGTNVATYDGSEAKTANITVTLSDVPHTHTVPKTGTTALVASKSNHSHTASSDGAHTHTVSGTVTSSLSGASAASSGPSVSYSATTGVLTITMNHTHTVSGTVTSSLSGAVAASDGAHTHTVPADTENIISVASQEHTHTTGQAQ